MTKRVLVRALLIVGLLAAFGVGQVLAGGPVCPPCLSTPLCSVHAVSATDFGLRNGHLVARHRSAPRAPYAARPLVLRPLALRTDAKRIRSLSCAGELWI